jgi:hypothetical protein
MNKCIIILDGVSAGKTKFTEIAKSQSDGHPQGRWLWSINSKNVLSVSSRSMGWGGLKDDKYYEYLNKLASLVDEYWDFKKNYYLQMIAKFKIHEKAEILVIHDVGDTKDFLKELESEEQIYFINITNKENVSSDLYDKTLNFSSETFNSDVLLVLKALLGD